ncbi:MULTISPECIES: hypothetical protein [Nitrospirillum]|uniref:hypothetical protein n=1 Tax=Nitrospirillum TaxID=1543705 RepID=UPI0011A37C5E|nr:hypothetical protein [Nitrospirillum amazonense]MEE3625858.1 hypothetical protein [Nitrospirillum sp. BR 11752]
MEWTAWNKGRVKDVAFIGLALLVALIYFVKRSGQPSPAFVNGTYSSVCCGSIVLADGTIRRGGDVSTYRLERMKFGLTAYMDATLTRDGLRASPDGASLVFEERNGRWTFATVVDHEYAEFTLDGSM